MFHTDTRLALRSMIDILITSNTVMNDSHYCNRKTLTVDHYYKTPFDKTILTTVLKIGIAHAILYLRSAFQFITLNKETIAINQLFFKCSI